jgi:hypothetical protein
LSVSSQVAAVNKNNALCERSTAACVDRSARRT